jgi:hypothetical protein
MDPVSQLAYDRIILRMRELIQKFIEEQEKTYDSWSQEELDDNISALDIITEEASEEIKEDSPEVTDTESFSPLTAITALRHVANHLAMSSSVLRQYLTKEDWAALREHNEHLNSTDDKRPQRTFLNIRNGLHSIEIEQHRRFDAKEMAAYGKPHTLAYSDPNGGEKLVIDGPYTSDDSDNYGLLHGIECNFNPFLDSFEPPKWTCVWCSKSKPEKMSQHGVLNCGHPAHIKCFTKAKIQNPTNVACQKCQSPAKTFHLVSARESVRITKLTEKVPVKNEYLTECLENQIGIVPSGKTLAVKATVVCLDSHCPEKLLMKMQMNWYKQEPDSKIIIFSQHKAM